MGYWGAPEEENIGLSKILALVIQIVIFIIAISLIVIAVSPLDFTGDLSRNVPVIVFVIALMVTLLIVLIVFVYIPQIITRE